MINKLIKLKNENPNLEVLTIVNTEEINCDSSSCLSKITNVTIKKYAFYNDEFINDDEDYLKELITLDIELDKKLNKFNKILNKEEFEKEVELKYSEMKWKKAIFIYIG